MHHAIIIFISITEMPSLSVAQPDDSSVKGGSDSDSTISDDVEMRPANRRTTRRVTPVPIAVVGPEKRVIKKPKRYTDN